MYSREANLICVWMYFLTGSHELSTSLDSAHVGACASNLYIGLISEYDINLCLPDTDGPKLMLGIGNLPPTSYLERLSVYSFILIGSSFGPLTLLIYTPMSSCYRST